MIFKEDATLFDLKCGVNLEKIMISYSFTQSLFDSFIAATL